MYKEKQSKKAKKSKEVIIYQINSETKFEANLVRPLMFKAPAKISFIALLPSLQNGVYFLNIVAQSCIFGRQLR